MILSLVNNLFVALILAEFLVNGVLQQKYYVDGKNVHYPKSLKHCKDGDVDYHKLWVGSKLTGGLPQSACELYLLGLFITSPHDIKNSKTA